MRLVLLLAAAMALSDCCPGLKPNVVPAPPPIVKHPLCDVYGAPIGPVVGDPDGAFIPLCDLVAD